MNRQLIDRLAEEWAQLDPADPLRRLLSDAIDALIKPAREPQPCPYVVSTREGTHHCSLSQREWVGLTLEDKKRILDNDFGGSRADCMDAAEKILREKNT